MIGKGRILVVEDDSHVREFMRKSLVIAGYATEVAADGHSADRMLRSERYDLVLSDIRLPRIDGLTLLERHCRNDSPRFVIVSGVATPEEIDRAMRLGAYDYVAKPFRPGSLQKRVRRAILRVPNRPQVLLIGRSTVFQGVLRTLDAVAGTALPVLLFGPAGSGRHAAARYIHDRSAFRSGAFVRVDCASMDHAALDREVRQLRSFDPAQGATLFLDAIDLLRQCQQKELLRALRPERGRQRIRLVSSATLRLESRVRSGDFSPSLYYRLCVFPVSIPRLVDRGRDLVLLARHYCREMGHNLAGGPKLLSKAAEERLLRYDWPGNVRELEAVIGSAVLAVQDRTRIEASDLSL